MRPLAQHQTEPTGSQLRDGQGVCHIPIAIRRCRYPGELGGKAPCRTAPLTAESPAKAVRHAALMEPLDKFRAVDDASYTHLRAHETVLDLVCRLLLEK